MLSARKPPPWRDPTLAPIQDHFREVAVGNEPWEPHLLLFAPTVERGQVVEPDGWAFRVER